MALRVSVRYGRRLGLLLLLLVVAAVSGACLGWFLRLDLPDVRALEDYDPPVMTEVLASDGTLLDTFAAERRIMIDYREIPRTFEQALIATEDADFLDHAGIDFTGIARAAWRDLLSFRLAQGASTLTQQLARNLFLHPDKTLTRKLQEALLALEIERNYSKQEILAFYCNQIYMGHGRYGLEAAARFYFGVPARDLNLAESALLAGLIQRPEWLSPLRHPERAWQRRTYVLERMVREKLLDEATAAEVRETPIALASRRREQLAPHFVEEVRRWLAERLGSSRLYRDGLRVRTTLDPGLQAIANVAVDLGVRELDRRQGWRGAAGRVPTDGDPETWSSPGWGEEPEPGEVHDGVVLSASATRAVVRVGRHRGELGREEVAWTGKDAASALFERGDLVRVRLLEIREDGTAALTLEQEPRVEAALVAIDPSSGAVRALVGGLRFAESEFNRAIQARRQTGSAFKPFVYAAALERGWTLADTLIDEPTVFIDRRLPQPYQPENYTHEYYETITLRGALEKSANIATVKLLDEIGSGAVIETARRLGITSDLRPYASLALGAFETTLIELTAAYGAFANQGVLVAPHLVAEVYDRHDNLFEAVEPEVTEAVRPEVAYLMNRLLTGVITDGTGHAAAALARTLAGKTGTTDENTDAWFIGYAPDLALGVWVGFDEPSSLGRGETGARAALPIWQEFMRRATPLIENRAFPVPAGITTAAIDRRTGLRANPRAYCREVTTEVFLAGTEPTADCTVFHHQRLRLPYPFQGYPLTEDGALSVPSDELSDLLAREADVRIVSAGQQLEAVRTNARGEVETIRIDLEIVPPSAGTRTLEPPVELPPEAEIRRGYDGRPPRFRLLRDSVPASPPR